MAHTGDQSTTDQIMAVGTAASMLGVLPGPIAAVMALGAAARFIGKTFLGQGSVGQRFGIPFINDQLVLPVETSRRDEGDSFRGGKQSGIGYDHHDGSWYIKGPSGGIKKKGFDTIEDVLAYAETRPQHWSAEDIASARSLLGEGGYLTNTSASSVNDQLSGGSGGGSGGGGGGGFLWKPISQGDGNLVVLMPKGSTNSSLSIKDSDGNVIETVEQTGTYDDGRPLFRFSKPGADYGNNISVGGQTISNGAQRFEGGGGGSAGGGDSLLGAWGSGSDLAELMNSLGGESVSGRKPEIADLERMSPGDAIRMSIESASENLEGASELTGRVNAEQTSQALDRMDTIAPGSRDNFGTASDQISELLKGRVPVDSVNKILSDRAELSSILGLQGGDIQTTLKDLGLTQLDAIDKGLSMFEKIIQSAERVDPVGRQQAVKDFQFNPAQVFDSQFAQNQIDQRTNQNRFNMEAAPDPYKRALFQLMAGKNSLENIPNSMNYNPLAQGPFENSQANNMINQLGQ